MAATVPMITRARNRSTSLIRFIHKAGAPLDNNVCKHALKKAILHCRNSMFYKTRRSGIRNHVQTRGNAKSPRSERSFEGSLTHNVSLNGERVRV